MNSAALITLIVTLVAAGLLISEKLRPDLAALLVMVTLGLSGVVNSQEAFAGFSGSAVMTIVGISIISEGLRQTGVTRWLGNLMHRMGGQSETRLVLVTTLTAAGLSLVMNNIAVVGVLFPAVMTLARKGRVSPALLMMPLAYGTALGGMATLLTTANLIMSGGLRDAGLRPFGLLDFLPIGLPVILLGALYMLTLGRRLMPQRNENQSGLPEQLHQTLNRLYGLENSLVELEVLPGCPLSGCTLAEGRWAGLIGLQIVSLTRPGEIAVLAPAPDERVAAGDRLLVQGNPSPEMLAQYRLRRMDGQHSVEDVTSAGITLSELVVAPHSSLIGRSLQQADFRGNYQLNVLALWREGLPINKSLAGLKLRVGDALLVQGDSEQIKLVRRSRDLMLLEEDPDAVPRPAKFALSLVITLATLALAAMDFMPIALVIFAGAAILMLTGCLEMGDAYRSIEWKAVFLIAGMWPLSTAIRTSGLAALAVQGLLGVVGHAAPLLVAFVFILIALVLTQIMSSQVAALVLAPLALAAAAQVGADPRALVMAAALGCSLSFPTPYGHPVNILVTGPGGYSFRDFVRVGLPLTGLVVLVLLAGLHFFWGL